MREIYVWLLLGILFLAMAGLVVFLLVSLFLELRSMFKEGK